MGVFVFIVMAVVGVGLIIYSFYESAKEKPKPTPIPERPTVIPTQMPTQRPTATFIPTSTYAPGGDEPPPLPPG